VVFVGTVVAEGGSEPADDGVGVEAEHGLRMTVHRERFSVERTLRGDAAAVLDLTIPDCHGMDVFEVGDRYLVFASPRRFGDLRVAGLAPHGYAQGVFRMGDDGTARNAVTGWAYSIDDLEADLRHP
jgi:hypothetical protein